jgi:hypothetical protein
MNGVKVKPAVIALHPYETLLLFCRGGSGMSPSLSSDLGFLPYKTKSLSPRVRLRAKPDFFIYVVKPEAEPKLSPTYLVKFSSPNKPEPKV